MGKPPPVYDTAAVVPDTRPQVCFLSLLSMRVLCASVRESLQIGVFQTRFFAFLQKKYGYNPNSNYPVDCAVDYPPTVAGLQNAQKYKQQFENMARQCRGEVVETGWSGQGAPGEGAPASPAGAPPSSRGSNGKECS